MCKVITIVNQKGGVAKTTTCLNVGVGLAREGKRVLLIDADPEGHLTGALGFPLDSEFEMTLADIFQTIINADELDMEKCLIHHKEGVDLVPCDLEMSVMELYLVTVMGRESIMKRFVKQVRDRYDYILIDCSSSLGMITINALACADSVLIPVEAKHLSIRGIQMLIQTIGKVKRQLNSKLQIEGVLFTMVETRINSQKNCMNNVRAEYQDHIRIFQTIIPKANSASVSPEKGISIYLHDPKGKVAAAHMELVKELLEND